MRLMVIYGGDGLWVAKEQSVKSRAESRATRRMEVRHYVNQPCTTGSPSTLVITPGPDPFASCPKSMQHQLRISPAAQAQRRRPTEYSEPLK